MRRDLRNREPLLAQLDSRAQDLLHGQLAAAEALDGIAPAGGGTGDGNGVHAIHGDLGATSGAAIRRGESQRLPDRLERALGACAPGPVQRRHLLGRRVVEEAEHVAADACAAGFGHVEPSGCFGGLLVLGNCGERKRSWYAKYITSRS